MRSVFIAVFQLIVALEANNFCWTWPFEACQYDLSHLPLAWNFSARNVYRLFYLPIAKCLKLMINCYPHLRFIANFCPRYTLPNTDSIQYQMSEHGTMHKKR